MRKHWMIMASAVSTTGLVAAAEAGGRARVEVSEAPRQVSAGQSFELAIRVIPQTWGHRRNVEPLVVAECGNLKVTASAVALATANRYRASLVLPSAGAWKVRVDSRYCETVMKPIEIEALAKAGARAGGKQAG